MFKAVIKASIQVKRGINEKDSSDIVEEFLDKNY
jgi:hypothetical protein